MDEDKIDFIKLAYERGKVKDAKDEKTVVLSTDVFTALGNGSDIGNSG